MEPTIALILAAAAASIGILAGAFIGYRVGSSASDALIKELRDHILSKAHRENAERESRERERADFRRMLADQATAQGIALAGVAPGAVVPDGPRPQHLGTGLDAKNRPVPSVVAMLPRENGDFNLTEAPQSSEFDDDLAHFDTSRHGGDPRFLNGRSA